ncbi:hypothetical protein LC55x_1899 [Lysobacter capsici]|nr:hypothetical protein LC55x_1899 [Lysobacter capsici]
MRQRGRRGSELTDRAGDHPAGCALDASGGALSPRDCARVTRKHAPGFVWLRLRNHDPACP